MTITTVAPRLGAVGRARASVAALETLAAIRHQARTVATADEQRVLSDWSGWGPLAPSFAPNDDTWAGIADQISAALPPDDIDLGMQGTYNSFYTPEPIAAAMWAILAGTGFTAGRVLEPGCGGGVFMRTAPAGVTMTGVERDTTAADICRLLNRDHNVINSPFEEARLPGGYAAAIGNVPFGDVGVYDPNAPRHVAGSLHDYFIWRTLDMLAPGGVAVLLTSRYTMDKGTVYGRDAISGLGDLVAAFRLPNGALGGGTDVIADVLVLRRKTDGAAAGFQWRHVSTGQYGHGESTNIYWDSCPDAVLGEMKGGRTAQYGLTIEVKPRPGDPPPAQMLLNGVQSVAATAYFRDLAWAEPLDVTAAPDTDGLITKEGWPEGSIRVVNDAVMRVEDGRLAPLARPAQELRDLLRLRDLAVQLVTDEANHSMGDRLIDPLRAKTAKAYTAYVRTYGALNRAKPCTRRTLVKAGTDLAEDVADGRVTAETTDGKTYALIPSQSRPTMGGFRKDPDSALVFALEVFDDETGEAKPAPILSTRQNLPVHRPTHADSPAEALAWSLNYRAGTVDLDYIGGLLDLEPGDVPAQLGDAVYCDPADRRWQSAEEYLSGDVRTKLCTAEQAAATLPEFARNVAALTEVLPPWLGPADIGVNIGSPWIGTPDVAEFIYQTLGGRATVRRIPETGQWEVDIWRGARESPAAVADWGTFSVDAYRLIELALNGKVPVVYRTVVIDGEEKKRKDPDASLLASEKQARLEEHFTEWLWTDPARTDRLVTDYNTRHNCLVARQFNGDHITVDGLAPWFIPYRHQREFVARALATPAALCGHPVGAGKTATMAMLAMKLRQLGLANKPMVVVPNHLIEQIDREFRQLFPAAQIISASAETISANRRAFNARVATQDWDIVLVTHSAFNVMPVSAETEARYIRDEVVDLELAVRGACPGGELVGRMVKNLAKRKDNLKVRLKELRARVFGDDLGVTFECLGVDYVMIDEAHYYKNLAVAVRTDGFSVRPSKRATGLEMKLQWLARRSNGGHDADRGGRYASLFTGTPVSNTMLELYVVLRYLMQDHLREIGMGSADAWAQMFVRFVTSVDVTIDGGQFQLVRRPALFINAPELRMLLSQVADIRTAEQLGLKRPAHELDIVAVEPTRMQQEYTAELAVRAEKVKGRGRQSSEDKDNMLAICGDGRRLATDPALVGLDDPEENKLHAVAARMLKVYAADPSCLQIGFCDVGTPNAKKGTQTYGKLRRLLTEGGMPVGRIRFIHDAKSDGDRTALFADCRSGRVSVILGSTDKLGVGTNIQKRVLAMHHVDAPWRPSDVEQRDGRGLRPGNRYTVVRIFRYVVQRTFDAYNWQLLTRKIGFISQVVSGKVDRTIEDISADVVDAYAAIKAIATGQPLLLEQAQVETNVKRMRGLQRGHRATVDRLRWEMSNRDATIRRNTREAEAHEAIAAAAEELPETQHGPLHEFVKTYRNSYRYSQPETFAGVRVRLGVWHTRGKDRVTHPLLHIQGGADAEPIEVEAYKFWTPQRLAERFNEVLGGAASTARNLRAAIGRDQAANERAAQSADRPFPDADALTAALARLDQINVALHAAALRNEEDQDAPPDELPVQATEAVTTVVTASVVETDPADEDEDEEDWSDDDTAIVFSALMDDYDDLTRDVFARLMAR